MDERTKNKKANIEGLKKEVCHCIESAYKKGYDIAVAENEDRLAQAKQEGYDNGHKDGVESMAGKKAYDKGLEDAWECLKKIELLPDEGGLTFDVLKNIFDGCFTLEGILKKYTVYEVVAKFKLYEKNDWRGIPADNMTEAQLKQSVKDLRKENYELKKRKL